MKWNNRKVLITGAAGFIGYNLLKRFVHLNAKVVALDNFSTGKPIETLSKMPVDIINADVSYRKTFETLPARYRLHIPFWCTIIDNII